MCAGVQETGVREMLIAQLKPAADPGQLPGGQEGQLASDKRRAPWRLERGVIRVNG